MCMKTRNLSLKSGNVAEKKQDLGVRSQNEEHLLCAGCLLLTAYCPLPS
jgi:hypothetical protein